MDVGEATFVHHLVKTAPPLIVWNGQLHQDALRRVRITNEEVLAAIRREGQGSLDDIDAVVLETDAKLSVIPSNRAGDRSAYGELADRREGT